MFKISQLDQSETGKSKAQMWIDEVYSNYGYQGVPRPAERFKLFEENGEVVGFVAFKLVAEMNPQPTAELAWIVAEPKRKGYGSILIRELQKSATENGINLSLSAWDKGTVSQTALKKFYKQLGFNGSKNNSGMIWKPELKTQASNKFLIKISMRDNLDESYVRFQLNDLLSGNDMSDDLKNFLCLHQILYEEQFEPTIKSAILKVYNELGNNLKLELLDSLEKWLGSHTSGEKLFGWDEYDGDKEATWAWQLVNDGEAKNHAGFEFDIKPLVAKNLLKLAREKYGKELTKDDIDFFKNVQDELTGSYASETYIEYLNENFREFIARKYTPIVFKSWQDFWGGRLKKPTKDVSDAVNRLKNCSMQELPTAISLALNTYHVHGQMIQHTDFNRKDLDYLNHIPEGDVEKLKRKLFGDEYSGMSLTASIKKISVRDKKQWSYRAYWIDPNYRLIDLEGADHVDFLLANYEDLFPSYFKGTPLVECFVKKAYQLGWTKIRVYPDGSVIINLGKNRDIMKTLNVLKNIIDNANSINIEDIAEFRVNDYDAIQSYLDTIRRKGLVHA